MAWSDSYRRSAETCRKEAHAWATHGHEMQAKRYLDMADTYEELAEEAEEREQLRSESR